jgi:hypothetical protein
MDKHVLTATQSNFNDIDSKKRGTINIKNLNESKMKIHPAALALGINQTESERAFEPPLCRVNIFKNTNGGEVDKIFNYIIDYPRARIIPDTLNLVQKLEDEEKSLGIVSPKKEEVSFGNGRYQKDWKVSRKPDGGQTISDYPEPD